MLTNGPRAGFANVSRSSGDAHLLDTIDKNARVVFYPSSGRYSREFQVVPYDVVILNSHNMPRNERIGKVYCFNYDNNELLGLLFAKGIKLSAVVIIRDGCVEGGNYECVARESFFGRLMPVVTEPFDLFCDHEEFQIDAPARFEQFKTPSHLEPFIRLSEPLGDIRSFHVTISPVVERDFILGTIRVKIIWDSIWRDFEQSDLVVVKTIGSTTRSIPYYLSGLLPGEIHQSKFEFVRKSRLTSIAALLKKANEEKLARLSLVPLAGGRYRRIVDEIRNWNGEYPRTIAFYHLNANDYQYLKSLRVG